ncbi:XRE family transcriptional regulator [Campylobacter coli]|nr:XRE family transcriptional regulator [Campylobacter coli]EAK1013001.1 XRE family transcriptional regulator [Campylobacter coli]EAK6304718.1 XRE family transcriptional regulator [Campylobacter coli]EHM7552562.1 XRE family transcriptional regulator [Campylobacter coli]EHQ8086111.1 XRE family transcriptional regulator [Campylobacter coli]
MAEEKENIVKEVCKELGLTYRQLGELIGLSEGRVKQLAIGEVGEQVEKACQMLIKIHKLEAELNEQKQLKTLLKNFIS